MKSFKKFKIIVEEINATTSTHYYIEAYNERDALRKWTAAPNWVPGNVLDIILSYETIH